MMGPLSFPHPSFQFLCSQWLPTAESCRDPKDRVHESHPPREEEGNRGRLACTFLMGNSSNLHSYSWPWEDEPDKLFQQTAMASPLRPQNEEGSIFNRADLFPIVHIQ